MEFARLLFKGNTNSIPIMNPSQRLLNQIGKRHLARGVGRMTDLVIDRAQGSFVHDAVTDKDYLDLTSGIAVTSTGHCHPKVVKAIQEQSGRLLHGQANIFYHQPMLELTAELVKIMPHKGLDSFFFTNSGAEAVEAAVKLARHATKRPNIVVFQGSFHGRTVGTMSLTTSKTVYSEGYSPLMSGVHVTPFPYASQVLGPTAECFPISKRASVGEDQELEDWLIDQAIYQFELLLKQRSAPQDTAAIIIEPVLGEGGYHTAPSRFLVKLAEICREHNILFIADEVQAGFGRTGNLFSIEHALNSSDNPNNSVFPDVLIMAKGMASGMPLSAIAASKFLMDQQPPGSMGGTYSGNPVACAAALATLRVLQEEAILDNVREQSDYIFGRLRTELPPLAFTHGYRVDIRGIGLMIGLEFLPFKNEPRPKIAAKISNHCHRELNTLIMTTSVFDTLRVMPPLTLNTQEAERCVDNILEATRAVLEAKVEA